MNKIVSWKHSFTQFLISLKIIVSNTPFEGRRIEAQENEVIHLHPTLG